MHRFKQLRVWQFARELVKDVYTLSKLFPKEETYVLIPQIRRAAISVLLNISEGAGRKTNKDFSNFLTMASGSAIEVETAAVVALDQGYISEDQLLALSNKIESLNNMIFKLQETLHSKSPNS